MGMNIGTILFVLFIGSLIIAGARFMEMHFSPKGEVFEPEWVVELDPADCDETDDKDSCYTYVAAQKMDFSWCEKVSAERLSTSTKLMGAAKTKEVFQKDVCYALVATTAKNVDLCEKVQNENLKRNLCYNSIAIFTNNVKLCNKVKDVDLRRGCKKEIKGILAFFY